MENCVFCELKLESEQTIVLSNEHCLFLKLKQAETKGSQLEGAGLIVPRTHRESAFDMTSEEWEATYELLHKVKRYIDKKHTPQGYDLGCNCGEVAGQHIFHAHFHIIPRYDDEPLSGKGIRLLFKSKENKRKHTEYNM